MDLKRIQKGGMDCLCYVGFCSGGCVSLWSGMVHVAPLTYNSPSPVTMTTPVQNTSNLLETASRFNHDLEGR